jgi:hypothetical protein
MSSQNAFVISFSVKALKGAYFFVNSRYSDLKVFKLRKLRFFQPHRGLKSLFTAAPLADALQLRTFLPSLSFIVSTATSSSEHPPFELHFNSKHSVPVNQLTIPAQPSLNDNS